MKDSLAEIGNEVVKITIALFVGGLTAYIQQKRKEKANKLAEIMASSDFWKKEVSDLKTYFESKVTDLQAQLNECNQRNQVSAQLPAKRVYKKRKPNP